MESLPSARHSAHIILINPHKCPTKEILLSSPFTDKETMAQRDEIAQSDVAKITEQSGSTGLQTGWVVPQLRSTASCSLGATEWEKAPVQGWSGGSTHRT